MLNVLNRMRRHKFEFWNNGIAQITLPFFAKFLNDRFANLVHFFNEFERHNLRFDWRQCKFECLEK